MNIIVITIIVGVISFASYYVGWFTRGWWEKNKGQYKTMKRKKK